MGNVLGALNLNCFCPVKENEDKKEIEDIKQQIQKIETRDIFVINSRLGELENNEHRIIQLDDKITRLADRVEMRFEMLFLTIRNDRDRN